MAEPAFGEAAFGALAACMEGERSVAPARMETTTTELVLARFVESTREDEFDIEERWSCWAEFSRAQDAREPQSSNGARNLQAPDERFHGGIGGHFQHRR